MFSTGGFAKVMNDKPWIIALIFIFGGPIVALKGKPFFKFVVTGIAGVFGTIFTILFLSLFTIMDTTGGMVASCLIALTAGGLVGYTVFRTIWLGVGVLGVVGGYFFGTLLYSFALALLGWTSLWAMILISLGFAIGGGYVSFKFPKMTILVATSGIGSYAFMRGWSYFFKGYPSES